MTSILVLVVAAAAFAFSLNMIRGLTSLGSAWFGVLLMLCVLGLFALARPVLLPRMPGPLRMIRPWERGSGLYRRLGVSSFGGLLRRTPLRFLNPNVYLRRHGGETAAVEAQAEAAEAAHFWAALVLIPYMCVAIQAARWGALFALLAVEVLGNIYPMLHLRLTRARIEALVHRRDVRAR